jgi:hypothetical protein
VFDDQITTGSRALAHLDHKTVGNGVHLGHLGVRHEIRSDVPAGGAGITSMKPTANAATNAASRLMILNSMKPPWDSGRRPGLMARPKTMQRYGGINFMQKPD